MQTECDIATGAEIAKSDAVNDATTTEEVQMRAGVTLDRSSLEGFEPSHESS